VGDGVGASVSDRVPMMLVTRTGRRALFAAVIEPVPAAAPASVREVGVTGAADAWTVAVVRDHNQLDTANLAAGKPLSFSRGGTEVLAVGPQ
jgi:hypothetical protein